MKKLTSVALFLLFIFSACKKQEDLSDNANVYGEKIVPPAQTNPIVYFLDGNVLYVIKNVGSSNPTIENKGVLQNVDLSGSEKANAFNNSNTKVGLPKQWVIYDPFLSKMIVADGSGDNLNQCLLSTRTNSKIILPDIINGATALKVGPDARLYYFSWGGTGSSPQIRSIKTNATDNKVLIDYKSQPYPKIPIYGAEINFDDNIMYFPLADGNIYINELKQLGEAKILIPAIFGESFAESEVRYDGINHKIFFSGIVNKNKVWRLYSMSVWGMTPFFNSIKKIAEIPFTNDDYTCTYDIVPSISTVVISKREYSQNLGKHSSAVMKVKMDGTGFKLLHNGTYINTVLTGDAADLYY